MNDFQEFLLVLVKNPEAHARFLNTLSLLEYIGARKILKSQNERKISMELLSHVSDELRHARLFKKLAEEIGKRKFDGYGPDQILCGEQAKNYFQTIDREVQNRFADPGVCYGVTTLLVEERVMKLYSIYEAILSSIGHPGKVLGILKEEEKHLHQVRAEKSGMTLLRSTEEALFHALLNAWRSELVECSIRHAHL